MYSILLICLMIGSVRVEESQQDEVFYEYENPDGCKCMNGGDCTDLGFCNCRHGFTGRFCETRTSEGVRFGCGSMIHNEQTFVDCSRCTCSNRVVTCEATILDTCNYNQFKPDLNITGARARFVDLNNVNVLKKLKLTQLVKLIDMAEDYSYKRLVGKYQASGYKIVFIDLDEYKTRGNSLIDLIKTPTHRLISKSNVYVYLSNEKIIGIYFPHSLSDYSNTQYSISASSTLIKPIYSLFLVFIFIKLAGF